MSAQELIEEMVKQAEAKTPNQTQMREMIPAIMATEPMTRPGLQLLRRFQRLFDKAVGRKPLPHENFQWDAAMSIVEARQNMRLPFPMGVELAEKEEAAPANVTALKQEAN